MALRRSDRAKADIALADPNSQVRIALRNALHGEGYDNIQSFGRMDQIRDVMVNGLPDLIVTDAQLEDGDTIDLLGDLRHGRIGRNPYAGLILTLQQTDPSQVKRAIDAGVDNILVKPVSPQQIMERINALVLNRKPFIVTSTYIGPDRRKDPSRKTDIPLLDVPNTLGDKLQGKPVSAEETARLIQAINGNVNEEKIRRNAFQLSFLVGLIRPDRIDGYIDKEQRGYLADLRACTEDHVRRIEDTRFAPQQDMCTSLLKVCDALIGTSGDPAQKDVLLLKPLTDAILVSTNENSDVAGVAVEISGAVDRYRSRRERANSSS